MHILFIGGTRFVGLAMAREALRRGHQVDLFHRGGKPVTGVDGARHLHGDRAKDLSALAGGSWDAVIDTCGYRPADIHALADALGDSLEGRGGRYLFVSSVSAYDGDNPHDADEDAPLASTASLDPATLNTVAMTPEIYGPLKVLCEQAVRERFTEPTILRPSYVIGPEDYTDRFPTWVRRIAAGGVIDAPGPRDAAVQYIDARDLARFAIDVVERKVAGAFNVSAVAAPFGFGQLLEGIVEGVAPSGTQLHWLTVEEAKAASEPFPLWHGGESYGVAAVSVAAARALGLQSRPLAETARDVLAGLA